MPAQFNVPGTRGYLELLEKGSRSVAQSMKMRLKWHSLATECCATIVRQAMSHETPRALLHGTYRKKGYK